MYSLLFGVKCSHFLVKMGVFRAFMSICEVVCYSYVTYTVC